MFFLQCISVTSCSGTIADVKRVLCLPPHNICSDASTLVLVLKGKRHMALPSHFLSPHFYVCSLHLTPFTAFVLQVAFFLTVLH